MKKYLKLFIVALLVFSFTACNNKEEKGGHFICSIADEEKDGMKAKMDRVFVFDKDHKIVKAYDKGEMEDKSFTLKYKDLIVASFKTGLLEDENVKKYKEDHFKVDADVPKEGQLTFELAYDLDKMSDDELNVFYPDEKTKKLNAKELRKSINDKNKDACGELIYKEYK